MRPCRSGGNMFKIDAGRSLIAGSKPTHQCGQRFEADSRRFVALRQIIGGILNGITRTPSTG
jgi:hypothetical protein